MARQTRYDIATTSITMEPRYVVRAFGTIAHDITGFHLDPRELHTKTREFESVAHAEAYRDVLDGKTLLEAFETDNGPGGISWELYTSDSRFVGSARTRETAEWWGATVFHTLEEWYASKEFRESQEDARIEDRLSGLTPGGFCR